MKSWSLQDAKARFSEVVNRTLAEGPQAVTRRGNPAVVVIATEEFERLTAQKEDLASFLLSAPRADLDIDRSREGGREVEL